MILFNPTSVLRLKSECISQLQVFWSLLWTFHLRVIWVWDVKLLTFSETRTLVIHPWQDKKIQREKYFVVSVKKVPGAFRIVSFFHFAMSFIDASTLKNKNFPSSINIFIFDLPFLLIYSFFIFPSCARWDNNSLRKSCCFKKWARAMWKVSNPFAIKVQDSRFFFFLLHLLILRILFTF